MKVKIAASCLFLLCLSFSVRAMAAEGVAAGRSGQGQERGRGREIPGGVVYSSGRYVGYHGFDGRKVNLTAGIRHLFNGPVAVSEDGKLLVWLSNRDFFGRVLPDGTPFLLPTRKNAHGVEDPLFDIPYRVEGGVRNLSISSDKHFIVYEVRARLTTYREPAADPIRDVRGPHRNRLIVRTRSLVIPVRASVIEEGRRCFFGPYFFGDPRTEEYYISPRRSRGYEEKMVDTGRADVCFPVWSKKGERLAYIYKQGRDWGPIGVYDLRFAGRTDDVRNAWEYPTTSLTELDVFLRDCEGLAWKPDGTVTYLSDGVLYSADGRTLVEGIRGSHLHWVSDDAFVFRGKDGALYAWNNGEEQRLLDSVPDVFSYCCPPTSGAPERAAAETPSVTGGDEAQAE